MKGATVYERGGVLFLSPSSLTTAGVWIGTEPLLSLQPGSSPSALGEAIITVLNASRDVVPHPTDWGGLIKPLLELAGVKSWATFIKKARCVSLRLDGDQLRLIPHRNLGGKEGYEALVEQVTTLKFPSSPNEIGDAGIDSISRCQ